MKETKTQLKGVIMLFITAFIWGSSFIAQSLGMEKIDGFTFSGIRILMGAITLLPFIYIRDKKITKGMSEFDLKVKKKIDRQTLLYGCILGLVFCAATNFQQFAFNYSSSGKIAFITALYMFLVPILGIFIGKRIPLSTWICISFGFIGLYFLCIPPEGLSGLNKGDFLSLICAVIFAIHILMIERLSPHVDGVKLSCTQFVVAGIISCILMFIFETPSIASIQSAIIPLLYSGVMSCGIAYTFQIIGQKYTESTIASLIMCTESVFAVIMGGIILHETLSVREIIGCIIMFAAIVISQLPKKS